MGLFITIEGPEGSGKTTIGKKIYQALIEAGYDVVYTREPGGSDIAEQIRNVILSVRNTDMDPRTEALLYAASRRQHLIDKVIPALSAGKIVLCDRYIDSSLAYQGYGRGIGMENIYNMNMFATEGQLPDLTLLFDISPEIGLKRISMNIHREVNRLDLERISFHKQVREAYLDIANKFKSRIKVIDASNQIDKVYSDAMALVNTAIKEKGNV